jgi:hypothetical protein
MLAEVVGYVKKLDKYWQKNGGQKNEGVPA